MSPTVFVSGRYRYFFFSREEARMHVHVTCSEGEAKFWLEPTVALADHLGLRPRQLAHVEREIRERSHEIIAAWAKHFR